MVREGSPYTGSETLILGGETLILGGETLILFKANLGRLFKLAVLLHGDAARAPLQNLVLSVVWRFVVKL